MELKIETTKAVKTAEDLIKGLELIEITTDEQYETSNQLSRDVAKRIKSLDETRKSITKPIDEAKEKVMDLFRPVREKLIAFDKQLKSNILVYHNILEKKRLAEEERLRKEQERKAAELRKRAAQVKTESKQEELEERAEEVENIVPIVPPRKSAGVHFKTIWKYKVVDFKALPDEYKITNETMLGNIARSTKGTLPIPGVKFYSEKTMGRR